MTTLTTIDALRVLFVSSDKNLEGQEVSEDHALQGRTLHTNIPKGYVRLVKRVTDPDLFTPEFAEAASLKLAANLAPVLTGTEGEAARLNAQADRMLENADTLYGAETPRVALRQVNNAFRGGDEFFDGADNDYFHGGYYR